jgi:P-type E1-E2 ATPase
MKIPVPGRGSYDIQNLVLDMNGTIALDGYLMVGVAERISQLGQSLHVTMVTADTHGGASRIGADLALETIILKQGGEAEQKRDIIRRIGAERSVAVGNGANDALMLNESTIGICVMGPEGTSTEALLAADIVVPDILSALDLLLHPQRLVATLRS